MIRIKPLVSAKPSRTNRIPAKNKLITLEMCPLKRRRNNRLEYNADTLKITHNTVVPGKDFLRHIYHNHRFSLFIFLLLSRSVTVLLCVLAQMCCSYRCCSPRGAGFCGISERLWLRFGSVTGTLATCGLPALSESGGGERTSAADRPTLSIGRGKLGERAAAPSGRLIRR